MRRRGKVIRGRFGKGRRRTDGLPPGPTTLLDVARKKRTRRSYMWLWSAAVAVGVVIGVAPGLLRNAPPPSNGSQALTAHVATFEKQPTPDWASRAEAIDSDRTGGVTATFGFCHGGGGTNCVVDGDTIWIGGQKVRVADIDAPETHDYRCPEEKSLGDRATQRLIQLMNSGPVTMQAVDRDEDVYGRKLRIVMVDGTSVGDTLADEGLARFYDGGRKPWC